MPGSVNGGIYGWFPPTMRVAWPSPRERHRPAPSKSRKRTPGRLLTAEAGRRPLHQQVASASPGGSKRCSPRDMIPGAVHNLMKTHRAGIAWAGPRPGPRLPHQLPDRWARGTAHGPRLLPSLGPSRKRMGQSASRLAALARQDNPPPPKARGDRSFAVRTRRRSSGADRGAAAARRCARCGRASGRSGPW